MKYNYSEFFYIPEEFIRSMWYSLKEENKVSKNSLDWLHAGAA